MPKRSFNQFRIGSAVAPRRQGLNRRRRTMGGANIPATRRAKLNLRTGGELGIELKYYDSVSTAIAINAGTDGNGMNVAPTTPSGSSALSVPGQGDGAQQRDGKKIIAKSFHIKGVIDVAQNSAWGNLESLPIVSIYLVMDTQVNGTVLTTGDVFLNALGTKLGNACLQRNMSYTTRFKVLKTWQRQVTGTMTAANNASAGSISASGFSMPFSLDWKGSVPINFGVGATSSTIASVADTAFYLLACRNDDNQDAAITYSSRMRFVG